MNDKEFLNWIYDRLHTVYGEDALYDYMQRLKCIIETYDTAVIIQRYNTKADHVYNLDGDSK